MPINPTLLAELKALSLSGKPAVAEYLKVTWDGSHTSYYGISRFQEIPPFTGIGHEIEARILGDPFRTFEINSDLRTETISIKFDDIDKDITGKFQTYGSGVQCELFYFYPKQTGLDSALTISVWFGQLTAPKIYGWKSLDCVATNGFRSREQLVPRRPRPQECTSNFGGQVSAEAAETMICIYQKQNGGPGNNDPATGEPYLACPRLSERDCIVRLGTDSRGRAKYFGGFIVDANAVAFPAHHTPGYIAVSEGNASKLSDPIRVVAGFKHVRDMQVLLWSRITPPTEPHGFLDGVWEIGEGPVEAVYNVRINDKLVVNPYGPVLRLGARGQTNTGYAQNSASSFSGTAVFRAVHGYVDTTTTGPDLKAEADVTGFNQVAVFSAGIELGSETYVRQWTDNRVWWLLELYSNQRWGMSYPFSRFTIADFITAADWTTQLVVFSVVFPDGETKEFPHQRTAFNAILEGRAAAEQIEDICRSGGLSVPFIHEGSFTISPFRTATAGELSAAAVFTDVGQSKNIVWDSGQPSITLSQTPNDKLVNEVEVTFEDSSNGDAGRPITVDDPDQKLLAGRELGDNNFKSVPKKFAAFGIRSLAESIKLAYRFLRFGDFDSGGTQNNLQVALTVPFEQALGIKRYEIIQIVSDLLDGFSIGSGDWVETPVYFRVLSLKKVSGGRCEIVAQAYNHTAYTAFEADDVPHECARGFHWSYAEAACVPDGPGSCAIGYHWDPVRLACVTDDPPPDPPPCELSIGSVIWNPATGNFEIDVPICPP